MTNNIFGREQLNLMDKVEYIPSWRGNNRSSLNFIPLNEQKDIVIFKIIDDQLDDVNIVFYDLKKKKDTWKISIFCQF